MKGSQMMELLKPRAPSQNICSSGVGWSEEQDRKRERDLQRDEPGGEGRVVGDDHPKEHVPEPAKEKGKGDQDRLGHYSDI
jgi:hypothetical protein